MSLGRRSDRVRKKVDYAKFCEDEEEVSTNNSDDDFQDDSGPLVKKAKSTAKTKTKKKLEEPKSKAKEPVSLKRKERLSRDEKLYKKELEAAIEASMKDSQKSSEEDSSSNANFEDEEREMSDEEEQIKSTAKKPRLDLTSDTEDNNKENSALKLQATCEKQDPSEGEESSNDDIKIKQNQKNLVAKQSAVKQEREEDDGILIQQRQEEGTNPDSDFEVSDEVSNGDSLSAAGEDSDFDEEAEQKKKKKCKGRGKSTSSPTKPSIKPRLSATVTPLKMLKGKGRSKGRGSSTNSGQSVSSSASNSPSISMPNNQPLHQLKANSTSFVRSSPSTGLGGVKIKTSGPPIRIGLSRNVRVKPLHSHVSVQH